MNTQPERIFAGDAENVASADILVDATTRDEVILGLRLNAEDGAHIVVPMTLDFAEQVGGQLLAHATVYKRVDREALDRLRGV